jgi:Xaa-Pro dipeptidase
MRQRVLRIFEQVPEGVDTIMLINGEDPNLDLALFYVTGADSGLFEGCAALLYRDGSMELLTSALEETSARTTKEKFRVFRKRSERDEMLRKALAGEKRLGVSGTGLSFRAFREAQKLTGAEMVDITDAIDAARSIKDKEEIERMRQACRIGSAVGDELPDIIQPGMTEYEAAAEVSYRMQKRGASAASFATNASFGANSAEPHHNPGDAKLSKGDTVLFDFGALYRRYGSDITRTFFHGKVSKKQRQMYEVVLQAQQEAIDGIHAGMTGAEADALARNVIDSSPFQGLLIHSLGHALGLAVHDGGRLAPNSDLVLRENMIMTVEPGVYVRGEGGVRIEDDVLITSKGCELLTNCSKELRVV